MDLLFEDYASVDNSSILHMIIDTPHPYWGAPQLPNTKMHLTHSPSIDSISHDQCRCY